MLAGPMATSQNCGSSQSTSPSVWYPDSGATHHVSNGAGTFSDISSLAGTEQILLGNCQGLPVLSIGSASLTSPYDPHTVLTLSNLLLVPTITKNLVSVSRFARDN